MKMTKQDRRYIPRACNFPGVPRIWVGISLSLKKLGLASWACSATFQEPWNISQGTLAWDLGTLEHHVPQDQLLMETAQMRDTPFYILEDFQGVRVNGISPKIMSWRYLHSASRNRYRFYQYHLRYSALRLSVTFFNYNSHKNYCSRLLLLEFWS